MPAAAVTPAPIAYIKVVAVKKLVVGCLSSAGRRRSESRVLRSFALGDGCQSPTLFTVGQHRRSGGRWVVGYAGVARRGFGRALSLVRRLAPPVNRPGCPSPGVSGGRQRLL